MKQQQLEQALNEQLIAAKQEVAVVNEALSNKRSSHEQVPSLCVKC